MAGKRNASVKFSDGGSGWLVAWDEPESFESIVSRNGGEPMDHRGDALVYSQFDTAKHTVEAPVEIVQRHRVVTISEAYGPSSKADEFTVGLRAISGPFNTRDLRLFAMSREQAQLFKVGSEIEVVLRPAPLA